ncbi:hypothetical protein K461DRAFT_295366 [Myriangium duriaei CBS 260.36]|uniref:AAA+ ATPase domain-containing protein n=1 Tax=Myriangium duriaei CBS 260.36 TaxID=1168546 RepID=A0A9P4ML19_9PEZI|nr:hypothetical protein K461DRAFT_295366 [Myriangium duriaei CBS 260.36]
MGILKQVVALTGYGALAGAGTLVWTTRKSRMMRLPANDYVYNTTFYTRLNPKFHPAMGDICVRKVPISDIKEEYLASEGKLVERFCAGVWSTIGFEIQRRYLERKYRAASPAQLWDRADLAKSDYPVGTLITDHFEVINHTPESIVVRCGDSPQVQQPRASDGVFEMVALLEPGSKEVELQLKSVFFNSETSSEEHPVPWHIEFAHRWYTKIWMESALSIPMAPSRGGRRTVVISDDEDDQFDLEDILSDEDFAPQKSQKGKKSPLKSLEGSPRKATKASSSKPSPTKVSPRKQSKSKPSDPKQENGKAKGTIFSFFNAATQRQQVASQTNSTPPTTSEAKIENDDVADGIDDGGGDITILNGSRTALAARKRKQNDVTHLFDPTVFAAASGSQKFVKTTTGSKMLATKDVDRRPWTERFAPVDLEELAVHKKKVSDVRNLLEESLSPRARPRLVVLKGPAGVGKTTTLRLLAKDIGLGIQEWRNPNDVDLVSKSFTSTASQFEDFLFRGGSFAGLELATDPRQPEKKPPDLDAHSTSQTDVRNVILIEEFPVTLTRSSSILQSFRSTLLAYLSTPHNRHRPVAPILIVVSETLLSSSSSSESMTPHRLLGPSILTHPLTATIEFNPIAPTLLTKALSLITIKESRLTGRRRTPGYQVLSKLAEMGDVRSAVSALEFLCVRGDEGDSWSAKINFSKPKGKTGTKANGSKAAEATLTEQEREALKIVGGRETALGLWHGVGKVVYNKRIDSLAPTSTSTTTTHSTKVPENDPEQLLIELGTDTSTFIAAVHENFVPSCTAASSGRTIESIDDCLAALSDADKLSLDRFGPGYGPGTAVEGMRQEEICFHVAVRGVVYSLPYPVKRDTAGAAAHRSRANVMAWPQSLRLWRGQEEMDDLADVCLDEYRKVLEASQRQQNHSQIGEHTNKGQSAENDEEHWWRPSAASKTTMILEQAPYMRLVQQARRDSSTLKDKLISLSSLETLHASEVTLSGRALNGEAGEEEAEELEKGANRSRRTRTGKKDKESNGLTFGVVEDVKGLVLSDDDIVDE